MPRSTYESTVLIVDDLQANRQLLATVLSHYRVREAEGGAEALRLVAEEAPDLILLDISMPGMDGFEVCRRLKASAETIGIPVIFITGNDIPGQARRCFDVGGVDFIAKPFDLHEVNARVHTHLALKSARESLQEQNAILEDKLREQQLNIHLAGRVLSLINPPPPSLIHLGGNDYLFARILGRSCLAAGGDHFLIRELRSGGHRRSIICVKDQSGHAVNCVLRSIITDLLHNATLHAAPELDLAAAVGMVNNAVCLSGLFAGDDFFTALFLDLDHESRRLRYVAAGHPAFLLIREGTVRRLPQRGEPGVNLPMGMREGIEFEAGELGLRPGDQLLLFTDGLTDLPIAEGRASLTGGELCARIQAVVDREGQRPVAWLMEAVLADIGATGKTDLPDDITLVGLEVERVEFAGIREWVPAREGGIDGVIEAVATEAAAVGRCVGCDPFHLRMALGEGLTNAWRHGNNGDDSLPITVGYHAGNSFRVMIADRGRGFDVDALADPRRLENRLRDAGRGIFCMRRYADYVGWQHRGRTLVLAFPLYEHEWEQRRRSGPEADIDLWRDPLPALE